SGELGFAQPRVPHDGRSPQLAVGGKEYRAEPTARRNIDTAGVSPRTPGVRASRPAVGPGRYETRNGARPSPDERNFLQSPAWKEGAAPPKTPASAASGSGVRIHERTQGAAKLLRDSKDHRSGWETGANPVSRSSVHAAPRMRLQACQ